MSEPTPGSDALRDLARQRTPLEQPGVPATPPAGGAPLIPGQAQPTHDVVAAPLKQAAEVGHQPDILLDAHWKGQRAGRPALGMLLVAAVLASAGIAVLTVRDPSTDNISLLTIAALAVVGLWAIMATTRPVEVVLKGSFLTVHHRDTEETFDLVDPFQPVQIRGHLGSPSWSLALGRLQGGTVVVGSRTVNPAELHPVVVHYRARAERMLRERNERFES